MASRSKILLWPMQVHSLPRFSPDWNIQSNKAVKSACNLFESSNGHNYLSRARRALPWLPWVGEKKSRVAKDFFFCFVLKSKERARYFMTIFMAYLKNPTNCNCYCSWQIHHIGMNKIFSVLFTIVHQCHLLMSINGG